MSLGDNLRDGICSWGWTGCSVSTGSIRPENFDEISVLARITTSPENGTITIEGCESNLVTQSYPSLSITIHQYPSLLYT